MIETLTQGAVSVIKCSAPLTSEVAEQFEASAAGLLAIGQPMAVLDMTDVLIVNSAGLESLLNVKDEFTRRGGTLKLACPNPLCTDILKVSGLKDRFEIHDDMVEALGSFGK